MNERDCWFKLVIVGGNQSAIAEQEIRSLSQGLEREGKVIFMGMLSGKALAAAYASADIFLHCSIGEAFGSVVLEYMESGVPVISRDKGG